MHRTHGPSASKIAYEEDDHSRTGQSAPFCLVSSYSCKTISGSRGNKQFMFAKMQKYARRDVERVFEVLQACLGIAHGAAMMWKSKTLWQLITCCVILHNMIVENEHEWAHPARMIFIRPRPAS